MRALLVTLLLTLPALAADNVTHEAGKHFQRGVDLYNDGDFRGALVEFKKAYDTWPRANVLYDIGQTQFQLMDYAGALTTMNRYLAETGPTAAHRAEVENTVELLRGRVGRVLLTTEVAGCDVSIDDQPEGSTPVQQAMLVSVGLRRVTVTCSGRPAISRTVEVSAGERVEVEMKVPPPLVARVPSPSAPKVEGPPSKAGMATGWLATGVLLVGTVAVGSSALTQQGRLESLRNSYPTTRAALDKQAALVQSLSIAADVLGAVTLVAAAVSTWATVKYHKESGRRHVAWSPTGVTF